MYSITGESAVQMTADAGHMFNRQRWKGDIRCGRHVLGHKCRSKGRGAPLRGVAQVVFHGVQVVEVGVQVRVHQDRGVEEDGEGQVEVEREVGEDQGETLMHDMRMT